MKIIKYPSLEISAEYVNRVSENKYRSIDWVTDKNESVKEWIEKYCSRNGIALSNDMFTGDYVLTFRTKRQLDYFVRIGNKHFPYFEFY